ncbi:class I SAM-dependent methyltransferase [Telluribacter sp. SYSU D00476]|uniref:class I SAM-dependent methyltransferase n=1 Tax=Telluribacter sp. SYSU D00476 TaxID=2811430 RepID=UPI001FF6B9F6|nr:class I SAM-dependent methyltransferase [Telluribacter sp. SYSU D00476]
MNRLYVLQSLIRHKKLKNYLEIGVLNGHIFFKIQSPFKVAVDPKFKFDRLRRIGKTILNPYNLTSQYFEVTSDDFFEQHAQQVFANRSIDLCLIDGMHEYGHALRDVENTLRYMSDKGVIVMHDCNPVTPQAARHFREWNGQGFWNGDVWKAILHLRSSRTDINVFVLDCDYGLGIITKGNCENPQRMALEDINSLSYQDLSENREQWLNLKPQEYFYEYFKVPRQ